MVDNSRTVFAGKQESKERQHLLLGLLIFGKIRFTVRFWDPAGDCAWQCFISVLMDDVSSLPSLTFSSHQGILVLLLKNTQRIILSLRLPKARKNYDCMSLKVPGGKKTMFSVSVGYTFSPALVWCCPLITPASHQLWYLSAEAGHWILPLLDTPHNPPSGQQPLLCLDQQFRHIFHSCQLLVPAFIDIQNSFRSLGIHMLNCQIYRWPFLKF